jgi:hypothetical protein
MPRIIVESNIYTTYYAGTDIWNEKVTILCQSFNIALQIWVIRVSMYNQSLS